MGVMPSRPSRGELERENERLRRENERLREKIDEQAEQILEKKQEIREKNKQIADLEQQLAAYKRNSTIPRNHRRRTDWPVTQGRGGGNTRVGASQVASRGTQDDTATWFRRIG